MPNIILPSSPHLKQMAMDIYARPGVESIPLRGIYCDALMDVGRDLCAATQREVIRVLSGGDPAPEAYSFGYAAIKDVNRRQLYDEYGEEYDPESHSSIQLFHSSAVIQIVEECYRFTFEWDQGTSSWRRARCGELFYRSRQGKQGDTFNNYHLFGDQGKKMYKAARRYGRVKLRVVDGKIYLD